MFNILFNSGLSIQDKFLMAFAFLFAMVIAFTMHEFSHGMVAYWNGDNTAKSMGRLSLNPLKHLDIMGTLLLLFVGFGWAKPVPINPNNFNKIRKGIFTVSIAGVSINLILAIANFVLLLIMFAISGAVGVAAGVAMIFYKLFYYFFLYGVTINLTLMAFNLLPIFPLDGFHVVESFTSSTNKFCMFMRRYGSMILFALLIISNLASRFGGIFVYFDIIGLFVGSITGGVESLMFSIAGIILT